MLQTNNLTIICVLIVFWVIFTGVNKFERLLDKSCKTITNTTEHLSQAIEICTKDENCKMFYSDTCDDIGPFKMCDSSFENSISLGGGCAYNKKEDTLGSSIPAVILKYNAIKL